MSARKHRPLTSTQWGGRTPQRSPAMRSIDGHCTIAADSEEELDDLAAAVNGSVAIPAQPRRAERGKQAIISPFPKRTPPGSGTGSQTSRSSERLIGVGDREALTEMGNARRFITQHGQHLCYVADRQTWRSWDGTRWVDDVRGTTFELAKETIRSLGTLADDPSLSDAQRRERTGFAKRSQTHAQIKNMVALAQSDSAVNVLSDQFDADPWQLNCRNGVVDLRTGQLMPHQPGHLCAQQAAVAYDPTVRSPQWLAFLEQTFDDDQELIRYVQRVCGYLLTGITREQCFWINFGDGGNGKSVIQLVMSRLMGDYAATISSNLLMVRNYDSDKDYHLAELPRKRFIYASESGEQRQLDEEAIKRWTGGEPIVARPLRQSPFTFEPQFKLMLAANHFPQIQGTDHGIWRRIKVVPFDNRVAVPNPSLVDELVHVEGAAILAWAVQGCLEYQAHGLQHPARVEHTVKGIREDMDALHRFLEEWCVMDTSGRVEHRALYTAYQRWCRDNGETCKPSKNFSADLTARKLQANKHARTRRKVWDGVRLRSPQDEAHCETSETSETSEASVHACEA